MSFKIAVAGKGGTGKTSLTGLLINYLVNSKKGPILAVDADANSNLNEVLGEEIEATIGEIREEVNTAEATGKEFPGGMLKADYFKYRLNTMLTEGNGYDLLVMGRTQGEGCYCYVNGLLKTQLASLSGNYDYIVIDNEAGMEHLSRGVIKDIDLLLLVSDCSRRGIQAAGRIKQLADELKIKIKQNYLIVNKAPEGKLNDGILSEIENQDLNLIGVVSMDANIYQYDCNGIPLVQLPKGSVARKSLENILSKIEIK